MALWWDILTDASSSREAVSKRLIAYNQSSSAAMQCQLEFVFPAASVFAESPRPSIELRFLMAKLLYHGCLAVSQMSASNNHYS